MLYENSNNHTVRMCGWHVTATNSAWAVWPAVMFMRPSARGGIRVRFRPTLSYAALNADEKLHIMLPNTWSTAM